MGRELRMIAPGWEHPRYAADHYPASLRGRFIPLHDGGFAAAEREWNEGWEHWQLGLRENYGDGDKWVPIEPEYAALRYTEYSGARPSPDDYMPEWAPGAATLYVMYEDTSEGTPISPPFETAEALARWLADTGASAFADMSATYEQWLATIHRGSAVSAVFSAAGMQSGVEFLGNADVPGSACEAAPDASDKEFRDEPNLPPCLGVAET